MRALFIGDSMIKYLHKYVSVETLDFHLDIVSYPGATIERLASNISVHKNYDWVLVHVGTNNASLDTIEVILKKYRALATEVLLHDPGARIIFSSIVPRDFDFHRKEYKESEYYLQTLNYKVRAINCALKELCYFQMFFFCSSFQPSWKNYLARDGLHLNKWGNKLLASCFLESLTGCISADTASKKIAKTQSSNSGFSFDDSEFPLLPFFPAAFVSSARPKQESAKPVPRPVQPARPKQESTRLISTPVQQSAALLTKDISSLPSSKGNTQFVLPVIPCIPFSQFSENVFSSIPTSNKFSVLPTNCKILHGGTFARSKLFLF
ncbi:uncharacterized protein LOC129971329 isoform X2 [Argiope bruennichi]|uniref:uncharacterized protein LOC129971329 isoform X2 n=1 Tax=Argiope bruennichi TaxID=94029 RepID=UPI002494A5C3|nr:uncharacterized protein LOC129971329 isoform X2 [Argiope bruennichi]